MTLILVPKPVPPGRKIIVGEKNRYPTCDRCLRESNERNPVSLSRRPSHNFREALSGQMRRDALCFECRNILSGEV